MGIGLLAYLTYFMPRGRGLCGRGAHRKGVCTRCVSVSWAALCPLARFAAPCNLRTQLPEGQRTMICPSSRPTHRDCHQREALRPSLTRTSLP